MPEPVFEPGPHLLGWVDDPERHAVAATIGPPLSQLAPALYQGAPPDNIFLFKAWKDALGSYPDYPAQAIGDCCSWGSGHALDLLQCIESVINKKPLIYHEVCTEAIYGMGREIGGMLRSGDGCYGSAVAKAVVQMGAIPRDPAFGGPGPYSGQRAKSWGRSGAPDDVKKKAAEHKLGAAAMVQSLSDVDAALANGYPGIVCSNQGFTSPRDSNGVCYARGSWAHCLSWGGRRLRDGKVEYLIFQSWGASQPGGPLSDDQPVFSFWAPAATFSSMLRAQDSFAFSAFGGFEVRPLPPHWTWSDLAA